MKRNAPRMFVMGTAFWTNPKHPTLPSHLHIVISDPAKNEGEIAIVNVTTVRGDYDASCVLLPADYQMIQHPSYVGYARAWVVNYNMLKTLSEAGQIHRTGVTLPAATLLRIQKGALASPKTPPRIKGLLAEQGLA